MSTNPKEIQKLVNTIIKARKIQKQRLEGEQVSMQQEMENIAKIQQPVVSAVEAVQKEAKQTVQALQNQQIQLAQIENKLATRKKPKLAISTDSALDTTMAAAAKVADAAKDKWIQHFYEKYKSPTAPITKLEINLQGNLGNHGSVNIQALFNAGVITMVLKDKEYTVKPDLVTKGLVALLLLPFWDIKKAKIEPSDVDKTNYRTIMLRAGFVGSKTNSKYKAFLEPIDNKEVNDDTIYPFVEDSDSDTSSGDEPAKDTSIFGKLSSYAWDTTKTKTGKGVFPYKEPQEISKRLEVLLGSVNAGNNSKEVKSEIRNLLDELLEIKQMLPTIHKMFYTKFSL